MPDVAGFLEIKEVGATALVVGEIITNEKNAKVKLEELITNAYPNKMFIISVDVKSGFTVVENEVRTTTSGPRELDKVNVIYQGVLPVNVIKDQEKYKVTSDEQIQKLDDCVKVLGFISPIILDSNLNVIDGALRLQVARLNGINKVNVVIIDDDGIRSDFLRLALNRMSEFQRWDYRNVDDYVDSVPQAQPLLEPLGFFGRKLLPESFFANSMLSYEIDVFNAQQANYRQESHIEDWAKLRKAEIEAAHKAAQAKKAKKKAPMASLFDLVPTENDFVETYDIDEEVKENVKEMKELAGKITENFDNVRKAEMEEKGQVWQNTRRNSKEVAEDKRNEFLSVVDNSTLTEDEKNEIKENIEEFSTLSELENYLKVKGAK